jgi:arabinose-5-phosphate isomerase
MIFCYNLPMFDADNILRFAKEVIDIETQAVFALKERLDRNFAQACAVILQAKGKVVVSGMGKSGHIARKIAATLASTGTPSFFMHPAEASHGDLGMMASDDIILMLSNSGESEELLTLVPPIKRRTLPIIAMTGNPLSTLARQADIHLDASVAQEACPLGLAPTSSTTAALVLGDALALALLHLRGFSHDDFALTHPGGKLGRRLLIKVEDLMHAGKSLPVVTDHALLFDALFEISEKGLGMTAVVDRNGKLVGIFTDGDLRRVLEKGLDLQKTPIAQVMTKNPQTIEPHALAVEAAEIMEKRKINGLLVVDKGILLGALNMHDLLRAKVI